MLNSSQRWNKEGPDRAVLSSSLGKMTACRRGSSAGRAVTAAREKKKMALRHLSVVESLCQHLGFNLGASANYYSFCYRSTAACWSSNGDVILFSNCRIGIKSHSACFIEKSLSRVNIQCDTQPFSTAAFFVPQTRLFPRRPAAWSCQQRLFCGWKKLC